MRYPRVADRVVLLAATPYRIIGTAWRQPFCWQQAANAMARTSPRIRSIRA
jgi:hypothetical protein